MPTHAALLRGINVGGHTATKGQLVAAFERAGLEDVATFRASGNVIFSARGRPQAAAIERELERELGFIVPVFLRSGRRLAMVNCGGCGTCRWPTSRQAANRDTSRRRSPGSTQDTCCRGSCAS